MTNAANEGRGAMRAGRLASRALLVLGGAVAATAAAWAVSSAAASADTIEVGGTGASVTPVTDATVANLGDITHGVASFTGAVAGAAVGTVNGVSACEQDATTWSEPGTSRPICPLDPRDHIGGPHAGQVRTTVDHEVAGRVGDAVADLGQDAVLRPVQRTLGAAEHIARKPQDTRKVIEQTVAPSPEAQDFGRKVWDLLDPGQSGKLVDLPALPASPVEHAAPDSAATGITGEPAQNLGAAAVSTIDPVRVMFPLAGPSRTEVPVDSHGASSHRDHRNLPAPLTPEQLPIAPPGVPAAPGGGTSAPGGHLDGLNFGVPSWVTAAVDNAVAGSTRAGVRHTPLSPGEQPGVTPD